MGTIRLLNLALFGHHGVTKAERETGTRLDVDVELELDLSEAADSDQLGDTLDYVAVHRVVEDVVKTDRHKLLAAFERELHAALEAHPDSPDMLRIAMGAYVALKAPRETIELVRKRLPSILPAARSGMVGSS